jgi:hypothetical protein
MAISYTPRLQLAKPDADEFQLVGVLDANYDLIDKYVGARQVAEGITPPQAELFDGALIHNKTSGTLWVAQANAAGGFDHLPVGSPGKLWVVPVRGESGVINNPGQTFGFTDPFNRGTVAWNRTFTIHFSVCITASTNTACMMEGYVNLNGTEVIGVRQHATTDAISGSGIVYVPAGTAAVFAGGVIKVAGIGTVDYTGNTALTRLHIREEATG